jgi:hypothetical protein
MQIWRGNRKLYHGALICRSHSMERTPSMRPHKTSLPLGEAGTPRRVRIVP